MKRYRSHKVVEAAPIVSAGMGVVMVATDKPDVLERVAVPSGLYARGVPAPGDYLVRYEPDGYLSWSPKAAFEAGYSQID